MAELYDEITHASLTNIVESCEEAQEVNQIVNYARDGTTFLQILGSPKKKYTVICYATRTQEALIESAWASGNMLKVTMSGENGNSRLSYGRIIELQKDLMANMWDGVARRDYYKVTLTLLHAPGLTT